MNKQDLIQQIRSCNRSARTEFLMKFSQGELARYLERLQQIHQPVVAGSLLREGGLPIYLSAS